MTPEQITAFNQKLDDYNTKTLHHFPITPEMREDVTKNGVPLYAGGGKVKPLSERFDLGPSAPFDPIGNAKKSLSGAYDVVSKIPGNLKRLVTDPVAYAKSLPAPSIEQLAGAFNPSHIGGIMMGPGSRTWNQKSFEDAVHLAGSKGNLMPPEEVWKRTGNIPNARDFVPRQEINDSNAKFYTPAELKYNLDEAKAMLHWAKQQPLLPKWSTLPDEHRNNFLVYADKLNTVVKDLSEDPEIGIKAKYVLDHPELYAAYPELGEILISQTGQSNLNLKGGFNSKNPEIRIYPQVDPRGTAIHEMQHAVQNIEGMSPGTSPSRYGEDLANYLKFHKAVTDAYPNLDPKQAAENAMHGWYKSHMGEAEARQATERMDMSPEERLSSLPDYDVEPKFLMTKPAEVPDITFDPALKYERPASYAKGGRVLYHGTPYTDKVIKKFEVRGGGDFGPGIYMTTSPKSASDFSKGIQGDKYGAVYPLLASIKNPLRVKDKYEMNSVFDRLGSGKPIHETLQAQGYDGIHVTSPNEKDPDEQYYVAFHPKQVKSSITGKAKGGRIKPVGYTKEQVTVSPNLDAMRYELMSVKHYSKKVK